MSRYKSPEQILREVREELARERQAQVQQKAREAHAKLRKNR